MKQWLTGAAAASILSAAALALCPKGRVRSVLRLVCGIVCALALLAPLRTVDITSLSAAMASYGQAAENVTRDGEEERKMLERTYIEEALAAYISDEAAALDLDPAYVTVTARWDEEGLAWYPWEAAIGCEENGALARIMEAELGIPAARQRWLGP